MSLKPEPIGPIPEETARVAKAAYPKGSAFMRMRDELGSLFQDEMFAALFPKNGQSTLAPWRLALVTIMQFAEGISDRQAAEAVRRLLFWLSPPMVLVGRASIFAVCVTYPTAKRTVFFCRSMGQLFFTMQAL